MTKLKPCPFCGSKRVKESSKRRQRLGKRDYFQICIYCQDCNTYGPRVFLDDNFTSYHCKNEEKYKQAEEKAIELWNNRIGD